MNFSNYRDIGFKRHENILEIILNRPASLNAVNANLHTELARVFTEADEDPDSDVIVLTGAGRAFCAGGDIDWMQEAIDNPAMFAVTCREGKRIVHSLLDCEKPIIAAVKGPAVGFGATLALFCDFVIAARHSYFSDPHVAVGMVAGDGAAAIWPQLIGFARAKEYLMLCDKIGAEQAQQIGLITRCVNEEDFNKVVMDYARRLCEGSQLAIRYTKLSINITLKELVTKTIDASLAYESVTNLSADHQEAVNSFREKRKPVFGE